MSVFRTAYGPKNRIRMSVFSESKAKQSFAKECDINTIMARYAKTGVLNFVNKKPAQFGDVTGWNFRDAMDTVAIARQGFALLPADIRARFGNDPGAFLDFYENPDNEAELVSMGLKAAPPPAAEPVPAAEPAAASAAPAAPAAPPPA